MSELIKIFSKLSEFYDKRLIWTQVSDLYQKVSDARARQKSDYNKEKVLENEDKSEEARVMDITSLELVNHALNDDQFVAILLELCATIRNLRSDAGGSYDNTYDCWDKVVTVSPRDAYLSFIYALAGLASLDPTNVLYTKVSVAAVNTYFLSLTIPGAKSFGIFEEDVITHCLQAFTLVQRIQPPEIFKSMPRHHPIQISVDFTTLFDDMKLVLRYVHFKDNTSVLDAIMKKLVDIQYTINDCGYANTYAAILHAKCFELYEEMINAHNGEPEETLKKLLNKTADLHTYAPKAKSSTNIKANSSDCEHISDWFIKCIAKYPRVLVNVLTNYIKTVVTNPLKKWKTEHIQRALEYAAKYDAALFTKSNESCVEFLSNAVTAEEAQIRARAVDLITRILQLESEVNWQMFRDEVSDTPRELNLIEKLINLLCDENNGIKFKAIQALHTVLIKGSPNAKKVLIEGIRFAQFNDNDVVLPVPPRMKKNEIRYEKPTVPPAKYSFNFNDHDLIKSTILHLPEYIYDHILHNPLSYVRRTGLLFLEEIIKINPLIIFNTNFVEEMSYLVDENIAMVRKQCLLTVDAILEKYPNCHPVIWVWCKIISPILRDSDPKNVEVAINCFNKRVLLNLNGIESSNSAAHFMPWVIIRTMLSTQHRLYLQTCFHEAVKAKMLSTDLLSIIESHLLTSNSTEAWVILNFVSGKIRSIEPDSLIHMFISQNSWNTEQNTLIALEVLGNCIKDFSSTALNLAFQYIISSIREGTMLPVLIGKAFDFLLLIDDRSQKQKQTKKSDASHSSETHQPQKDKDWVLELHNSLEDSIMGGIKDFPDNRATFISHLFSYSDVNLVTRIRPRQTIVSFIHKYINECLKLSESELDSENERLFNNMIVIAGRLSLRDSLVASTTCMYYGQILRKIDRPPIVNTVFVALTDLCKKHTQVVERILEHMLQKLSSPYVVNREKTFECFEILVLQDQLKLRGSLRLSLIAAVLDENPKLRSNARQFFADYLVKKNPALFQQCLTDYPFVLNEYKNFEGLDSFAETCIHSPLKGEEKRKSRQILYNYFMSQINEVHLVLHFEQLQIISEKAKCDALMKSPEGVALINDELFILRKICQLPKVMKAITDNKEDTENKETEEVDDALLMTEEEIASTSKTTNNNAIAPGRGRGRKRREELSMPHAITKVEKSLVHLYNIYNIMHKCDASIVKSFDDLCKALNKTFPAVIKYAQPAEFWDKYRKADVNVTASKKSAPKRKSRAKQKSKGKQAQDSIAEADSDDSDFCSDDDLPLISKSVGDMSSKRLRLDCRELPMEYLFNPSI